MNIRKLFASILLLVCVLLSACAPAATAKPPEVTSAPATVAPTQSTEHVLQGDPIPDAYLNTDYFLTQGQPPLVIRLRAATDPQCMGLQSTENCFTMLRVDSPADPGARGPAVMVNGQVALKFQLVPYGPDEVGNVEYFGMKDGGTLLGVKCETKTGEACNSDVGTTWSAAPQIIEHKIPTFAAHAGGIKVGPDGAIWFVETTSQQIGRIDKDGKVTEFPLPNGGIAEDQGFIAVGPDGALWFNEEDAGKLGRITVTGEVTEFDLPEGVSPVREIVTGPDNALWATSRGGNAIVKLTNDIKVAATYPLPQDHSNPTGMVIGPDKAFWFVETGANQIGRITTDGQITEYPIPVENSFALRLTAGPDNAIWFTMFGANKIGRIDMNGKITAFDAPNMGPVGITTGVDGAIWFTGYNSTEIGRMTTDGMLTKYPVPTYASVPYHIVAGPDGSLWFTEQEGNMIGQIKLHVP